MIWPHHLPLQCNVTSELFHWFRLTKLDDILMHSNMVTFIKMFVSFIWQSMEVVRGMIPYPLTRG